MHQKQFRYRMISIVSGLAVMAFLGYIIWFFAEQDFRYDFLRLPFAADIGGGFVKINSSDVVWLAALKGVANTLLLVFGGIVFSFALGLLVGVARLSNNPLLAGVAHLYVEVARNIPLLVLMFLFTFVVFAGLPGVTDAVGIPGLIYFSNRGFAVPRIVLGLNGGIWLVSTLVITVGALFVRGALRRRETETGKRTYAALIAFGVWVMGIPLSYAVLGRPATLSLPIIDTAGFFPSFKGGFILSAGYVSALLSVTVYFGAFIAEIVRGSILAIPKQQTEAAASLGLNPYARFALVILPQALRIMIPSLNNEFQNANKDSSLAHLITYSEIVFIALQTASNRGNLIEIFVGVFLVYVVINLVISVTMNALNKMVKVVT